MLGLQTVRHERTEGRSRQRGFTLIELVVTLAIMCVIMVGIGSAMLIVSHAVPTADNPAAASLAASSALGWMIPELEHAVTVTGRSATMIEFTVADRNGDDVPETIRYEWSGSPGDSLARQYNSGAVVGILSDVTQFDLSYDLKTSSTETSSENEGAEYLLVEYDSTQDLHDFPIKDGERYAQYFFPSLPGDAISWRVTRVRFHAKVDGANDGECRVELQLPTAGGVPGAIVLEAKPLLEASLLDTYTQQELSFTNVSGLSPQQGLCLVFRWIANGTACKLHGQDRNVTTPNSYLAKSADAQASWSKLTDRSLFYQVYGTVTVAG
ncbi:MAG: type II secretion system protein, partial [Planctomycetota bacterium]